MTLNGMLRDGFSTAHRRLGVVLIDLLWKAIWIVLTTIMTLGALLWINSRIGSLAAIQYAAALDNPLVWAAVSRQAWAQYASTVGWTLAAILSFSVIAWFVLEAFFRAGLFPDSAQSFLWDAGHKFKAFITLAAAKWIFLTAASSFVILIVFGRYFTMPFDEWRNLPSPRAALLMVSLVCGSLWFALTVLETLVRADTLELLGTELLKIVGAVGTLVVFEAMIAGSFIAATVAAGGVASGLTGVVFTLIVGAGSVVVLSVLHSYLLLVRYSSIAALARTTSVP